MFGLSWSIVGGTSKSYLKQFSRQYNMDMIHLVTKTDTKRESDSWCKF